MKVAIFGASGLVGSRLFERWIDSDRFEPVPIVHSTGNAWRIVRHGRGVRLCNLLDLASVRAALQGCDGVVNATRGGDEVMRRGLSNLLAESTTARVRRFVHLSSVLVYGDPPPASSRTEDSVAEPVQGTYGAIKAAQDALVARAASAGLSCAVLCPPNIGGPGSYFLSGIARALADGSLALLDGTPGPCNLVDIDNLCDAIELALERERVSASRLFVVDRDLLAWPDVVRLVADGLGIARPQAVVSRQRISQEWARRNVPPPRPRLVSALRHLGSSRVRSLLREDPLLAGFEDATKRLIRKLRPGAAVRLTRATDGPARTLAYDDAAGTARPFLYQQLRSVHHSTDKAGEQLGYTARLSSAESIAGFCRWFLDHSGWDDREFGDLARIASDIALQGPSVLRARAPGASRSAGPGSAFDEADQAGAA